LGVLDVFGIVNDYLLYCVVYFYSVNLTLSTCVWRWSCTSLHGSIICCRWCWWGILPNMGYRGKAFHGNLWFYGFSWFCKPLFFLQTWNL